LDIQATLSALVPALAAKTSDIVGSHLKTDLDSYLTLIRRKIQEKCATTHELITLIRRSKIGDSKFVTPNEFRFTLIKFGVIIAQSLVDIIFNVFDSDRSGSMDFDEFAMWIMNSEFKPAVSTTTKKLIAVDSPEELLRKKLGICIKEHEEVFTFMKKKISFLEFVSEINRKNMRLADVEARQIFLKFDPLNTGFVDSAVLLSWGRSGIIPEPTKKQDHSAVIPSLAQCINIVSVRNSKQMEKCFAHIPEGAGVRIKYEEFRRCLVQGGLGKNALDSKDLFLALGGESGVADIDSLFKACKKLHLPDNPRGDLGAVKHTLPPQVNVGRAARRLRDAMRKSFGEVKAEIIAKDVGNTGFINAEDLHAIMVKHCMPITFQDFRYIVQQLRTEEGGSKVDWRWFLHLYNPRRNHHALNASASLPALDLGASAPQLTFNLQQQQQTGGAGATDGGFSSNQLKQQEDGRSAKLRPMTSSDSFGDSKRGGKGENGDLRRMWQLALRLCHKADPDRTGQVNRVGFIQALETANPENGMTAERMNQLAAKYTGTNGLVDYMVCFREFLTDISSGNFAVKEEYEPYRAHPAHVPRDKGASHPWDFQYKKEKQVPYWFTATSVREGPAPEAPVPIPAANEKSTNSLTEAEKSALLAQYNPKTLSICSKCYAAFLPVWKALRNELTRSQIISQRGSIIVERFQAILEHFGARLTKGEWGTVVRSFRGTGLQDVVKFDDFLRVCMLVKGNYDQSS